MTPRIILASFFLFLFLQMTLSVSGQTETEIDQLKKKAELLNARISDVDKKVSIALRQKHLSQKKIALLEHKINTAEDQIKKKQAKIDGLKRAESNLKEISRRLLVYAYKSGKQRSKAIFLLSADDFKQAYKRFLYVRYYQNLLSKKLRELNQTELHLKEEIQELDEIRQNLYTLAERRTDELIKAKRKSDRLADMKKTLKSDSEKIRRRIQKKREIAGRLNSAVNAQISDSSGKSPASRPFTEAKGSLPFPMKGVITQKFGNYRHEVLENVTVKSDGIEISGRLNALVRSVFNGQVVTVREIPGANKAVIIKHGNYFTVYSNLNRVFVKSGQAVKSGTKLGICGPAASDPGHSELYFQIWYNRKKLDPQPWLK